MKKFRICFDDNSIKIINADDCWHPYDRAAFFVGIEKKRKTIFGNIKKYKERNIFLVVKNFKYIEEIETEEGTSESKRCVCDPGFGSPKCPVHG